jgi:hypothetical protein
VPPVPAGIYIFNSTALLCMHPCYSDVGVLCITEKCCSRSVFLNSKTLKLYFLFFNEKTVWVEKNNTFGFFRIMTQPTE